MKKRLRITTLLLILLVMLTGCACEHEWNAANCVTPQSCKLCGETEGKALGHSWKEATCTKPKTCSVCGETEGTPRAHDWKESTCDDPKTCRDCGKTNGSALGHNWQEATCTQPATCARCGETTGATSHTWANYGTDVLKTCSVCSKQVEFFYSPKSGALLAWTEYEMINYMPANPVSYIAKNDERVDWGSTSFQEHSGSDVDLFYANGKIYYSDKNYCDMDDNIAYNLALTASWYIPVRYYSSQNYDLSVKLFYDNQSSIYPDGYAFASFDVYGTQHIIVITLFTENNEVYAVRSNWKY